MRGELAGFALDPRTKKPLITIRLDVQDYAEEYDRLNGKVLDIEIKEHREKRSRNANNYLWVLCGAIAERLDGETKDTVYKRAIKERGIYRDITVSDEGAASALTVVWSAYGTGWFVERVDAAGTGILLRCYYGSSSYNTAQMSRVIDGLVQDARALGIPTETDVWIKRVCEQWGL